MPINICRIPTLTLKNIINTFKSRRECSISKRWVRNYKFSIENLWKSSRKELKRDWKRSHDNIWINVSKTIIEIKNKTKINQTQDLSPLSIKLLNQRLILINIWVKSNFYWRSILTFWRISNVFSKSIWTLKENKLPSTLSQLIHKFLLFGKTWLFYIVNTKMKTIKTIWK